MKGFLLKVTADPYRGFYPEILLEKRFSMKTLLVSVCLLCDQIRGAPHSILNSVVQVSLSLSLSSFLAKEEPCRQKTYMGGRSPNGCINPKWLVVVGRQSKIMVAAI